MKGNWPELYRLRTVYRMMPPRAPKSAGTARRRGVVVTSSVLVAAGAVLALGAGTANAVSSSGSVTASVTVQTAITMSMSVGSFSFPATPGGQTTAPLLAPVTETVTSNDPNGYTVTVQASGNMAGTGGNTDTIPIGNMSVRDNGTTPWSAMSSASPVTVKSTAAVSGVSGDAVKQDFQLTIPPTVKPDTYSTTLNYTATAK